MQLDAVDLAVLSLDLPQPSSVLLANRSNGAVQRAIALFHHWRQVLTIVLVPEEVELQAKPVALHLREVNARPTWIRRHLLWVETTPGAQDLVRGVVRDLLRLLFEFLPGEAFHLPRSKGDAKPAAHRSFILTGQVPAGSAAELPTHLPFSALVRSHAGHILPGLVHGGVDLLGPTVVPEQIKLLPTIGTQGDLVRKRSAGSFAHLLRFPHGCPGTHDLVAGLSSFFIVIVVWCANLTHHQGASLRHLFGHNRRCTIHLHLRFEGHLVFDLPPGILQGASCLLFLVLLLLPRLSIWRQLSKMLARVAILHLVVVQRRGVHDLSVHRACAHAAAVVEPSAPGINLQQVVGVQLVGVIAKAKGNAAVGPVIKLHPGVNVDLMKSQIRRHMDGIAVELLHLPHRQWIKPGHVVEAQLVHRTGAAGTVGEDQEDLTQGLLPLRHHH
mmetsp:Transcript_61420/g.97375  ORF Transcript_61420/g.97375 Transcript_61420/m.97375 type:complete len:442 (-) Transcript_61420:538-1863(-)